MNAVKVVTGIVTIANAHIWEPIVIDGSPPMYTATIIIPKDEQKTITGIRTAVENAVREGNLKFQGSYFGKTARKNTPILDGDAEGMSGIFKNSWVVNSSTFDIPSVVDHIVLSASGETLDNPYPFNSKPYIRIDGTGAGTLTIQSEGSNAIWNFESIDGYVEIDSEQMNFYKDTELKNDTVTGSGFPILYPGENTISYTGGITAVTVIPRWCCL